MVVLLGVAWCSAAFASCRCWSVWVTVLENKAGMLDSERLPVLYV